jgi:dolichyl-phosphate beta-glucosyltransferase
MSNARPYLSIVIPAYNEAARIAPTLRAVAGWVAMEGIVAEILVVDDGSSDATVQVVEQLADELGSLRVIASTPNLGKGHAVRLGMLSARGTLRLFMDADHSTPVHELPKLLDRIAAGADVAIGSRRAPGAVRGVPPPWYRRAWSRLANQVVQAQLLAGIHDTQCGFKLFTAAAARQIFARVTTCGWGFDLEALVLARQLGYRIDEVAVTWSDDPRSRIHPLRDAVRITRELLRIRRAVRREHARLWRARPRALTVEAEPWGG